MKLTLFRKSCNTIATLAIGAAVLLPIKEASGHQNTLLTLDSKKEIEKIILFLTSDIEALSQDTPNPGFTYVGTAGELQRKKLPLSFYCTNQFWEQYVLQLPGEDSNSADLYNHSENTFTPMPGSRGQLQVERINIKSGCNIYDAATWQIALALAGDDGVKGDGEENIFSLTDNQNELLKEGYDGKDAGDVNQNGAPHKDANRGVTVIGPENQYQFLYNGCVITNPQEAYFYRQVPKTFKNEDPLGKTVQILDTNGNQMPDDNVDYPKISISWTDWKPITGENIWAFLIGPLHTALIKYKKSPCVPFESVAVQNAIAVLGTFQKMQSGVGGIYYAPSGSMANIGTQAVSRYEVSVENNISALGGLLVFRRVLQEELSFAQLSTKERYDIRKSLGIIQTMLYGGTYQVNSQLGQKEERRTHGLLSFLKNEAWDATSGRFYSGGEANKMDESTHQEVEKWLPHATQAVDVNTWGLAVLGQNFLDSAYGFGTAYQLWVNLKSWGGYYGAAQNGVDQELWGVGYSDLDHEGNGKIDPSDHSGILSGEWTAGAITALRALITQYDQVIEAGKESPENIEKAQHYVADLRKDHDAMITHIQSLRTDRYADEKAFNSVRPTNYSSLINIPTDKLGYLYASKRYLIPFGWYANPIPSMASTTWAVMLHYNFNPFSVKGDYSANDLSNPEEEIN
ncbi:MAG: hypothetical protein QE493_05100 [Verrucomicrobiae bacterium]|jgi:hypothetical protein|nr:hypothetical protein [Verrucomicrobiae bacterium]